MDSLAFASATETAARIRSGEIGAMEATEACLARIQRAQPRLNAFVDVDAERTLTAAAAVRPGDPRPFAGVPIAIKANTPVAGHALDSASALLAGFRPPHSAYLVRRLEEAGFIVAGITNMPEFGILPTTEPRTHGATRNPWNPERTPGGSSGGAAAAVAAGLVPVAQGNDGGGSLRIPAACCGLVGLKPSRGRVSRGPDAGDSFLVSDSVLTRSVADTALLLDVLAGYEAGDATWAPRPAEPYAAALARHPGRLRIAASLENPLGLEPVPESIEAVRATAACLEALGHSVEEVAPPQPDAGGLDVFLRVFGPAVASGVALGEQRAGRAATDDELEPLTRWVAERAAALPSTGYLAALGQLQALARVVIAFFATYDLLLTPVLAMRPLAIGELHGCGEDPDADLRRSGTFAPYTPLWNATGQPAISVPAGLAEDGLPTAVQLVGRPLAEETLLQVAAQLEVARPWAGVRPL